MQLFTDFVLFIKFAKILALAAGIFLTAGGIVFFNDYEKAFRSLFRKADRTTTNEPVEKKTKETDVRTVKEKLLPKSLASIVVILSFILTISGVSGYTFKEVAWYCSKESYDLAWEVTSLIWSGSLPRPTEPVIPSSQRSEALPAETPPSSKAVLRPPVPVMPPAPPPDDAPASSSSVTRSRPAGKAPLGVTTAKQTVPSVSQSNSCVTSDIGEVYCAHVRKNSTADHVFSQD